LRTCEDLSGDDLKENLGISHVTFFGALIPATPLYEEFVARATFYRVCLRGKLHLNFAMSPYEAADALRLNEVLSDR
jgi:hypothetical protein